MTSRPTHASWREFERVVAMIEESALPRGATVRSPDHIRDLVTGEMREVDASIRFRLGTADVLVTVECQRRSRKASDMWIEQLATKRCKIGAAKTIAVSAKGFTKSARLTASRHGIELRTLSEIAPADVDGWFLAGTIVHAMPSIENVTCAVRLTGSVDYVEITDPWLPCFFHEFVDSPFPALVLWEFHGRKHPRRFQHLPRDGSVTRVHIDLDAIGDLIPGPDAASGSETVLSVELGGDRNTVASVRLSADVLIQSVTFGSDEGVHHTYDGVDGRVAQHAQFKGRLFDLPVVFDHVATVDRSSVVAEFPSGVRLGLEWTATELPGEDRRTACAFCDARRPAAPTAVLPDFLTPAGVTAKEWLLCPSCSERFDDLDAYVAEVWQLLPRELPDTIKTGFGISGIDGTSIRLWLLSVLWRMGASSALKMVDLGAHADALRDILSGASSNSIHGYPVACIVLSSEGRRADLFFPPQWANRDKDAYLCVVLDGVLFHFGFGCEPSSHAELISDSKWTFPVWNWRDVSFLVQAALQARAERETYRTGRHV